MFGMWAQLAYSSFVLGFSWVKVKFNHNNSHMFGLNSVISCSVLLGIFLGGRFYLVLPLTMIVVLYF